MHFLSEDLENYACEHTDNEPPLLQELSRRTHLTVLQPRMISGHLQGRFLSLLSKLIQPKTILEIDIGLIFRLLSCFYQNKIIPFAKIFH